jgi:hypothetical protein
MGQPNQGIKPTEPAEVHGAWLMVGLNFYYYIFSTSLVGEYLIWFSA